MNKEEGRRKKEEGRGGWGLKLQPIINTPVDQKIRSESTPFSGIKKNQVKYLNPNTFLRNAAQTDRGTDN
ncbi:MAG: hypothetical protein F6K48_10480 [Okeania sp. SIO3H1]|uniref:hypothetical protein n=1 Tax=Okeania sp. SIO1I7 TaxID=2607772 RepID=UPI0013C64982|nr:hypothetical protein [Okeania sp. SIO1I7]NEN89296.1 hypothetical protein [Okeania sp. SIO3H1]NET27773.1 hypothetical protein [Okeania sp. SIO1I7]